MRTRYHLFVTIFAVACLSSIGFGLLASEQAPPGVPQSDVVDRFQRTYEVLQNNEVATSGVARGETIYFYKCWMCHQELASPRRPQRTRWSVAPRSGPAVDDG